MVGTILLAPLPSASIITYSSKVNTAGMNFAIRSKLFIPIMFPKKKAANNRIAIYKMDLTLINLHNSTHANINPVVLPHAIITKT